MKRHELEHIIRASAGITGADRFVIIGSQAIHGQFHDPPAALIESLEADVFTMRSPDDANLIEGSIGEGSPFHSTFGYYAHGVGVETAVLPSGWNDRLVEIRTRNTGDATGLCLEVHDLAVSKLVAGRPKDLEFVTELFRHGLVRAETIMERLAHTAIGKEIRELCGDRLKRCSG